LVERKLEVLIQNIENVQELVYLRSLMTWDSYCSKTIRTRTAKGLGMEENLGEYLDEPKHQLGHETECFGKMCI
jgi:hypothetical protein